MNFDQKIDSLPATSPITIRRLKSLGINNYWDLLNYFPFRYEDYSLISTIDKVQEGEVVTIIGEIIEAKYQVARTGTKIQKFILQDKTGNIELNFYNQPYLLSLLKKGMHISVAGEIKKFGRKILIDPKEYEINLPLKHTGRLVPVYPEKRGLSSKTIREKEFFIINHSNNDRNTNGNIEEIFPKEIVAYNNIIAESTAYYNIHFPENHELAKKARERLSFDELFLIQLTNKLVIQEWKKEVVGNPFNVEDGRDRSLQKFINNLPFKLTNAQNKVVQEIKKDLEKITPMNRFLQGEVGSGKTVVAAIACYLSFLNGYQSLFMAPTEILAEQHYQTITSLFNLNFKTPNICLITGSNKPTKDEIAKADIIIGTHALIQKKIRFNKVGLVVIDEQHRFGVSQRAQLKNKGLNPHLLTMTATPIPRTVALILYGGLDISVLNEMPIGRLSVKTYFIPKNKRQSCYQWIKKQISISKVQVFIICPLIEESDTETLQSVKAAKKEYDYLKNNIFNYFSVGLLHGKLKSEEKNQVMNDFKKKKFDILVATPVVEVGIDVPNATIMIIEGGERFGLAQLHQLRGRVGRGKKQSYCFVFSEKKEKNIINRLNFFTRTQDGSLLAEMDLQIRGPGQLFGIKQHGYVDLKIAQFNDYPLIEKTKKAVNYFNNKYKIEEFKGLERRIKEYKVGQISRD